MLKLVLINLMLCIANITASSRHIFKRSVYHSPMNFFDHQDSGHNQNHVNKDNNDKNEKKNHKNKSTSDYAIKNVKDLYICEEEDKNCEKILEINIPRNIAFDCYEKYLPIYFEVSASLPNGTKKKDIEHGFLVKDKSKIASSQKISNVCYQIKRQKKDFFIRYLINDNQRLIMIDDNLILTDKNNEIECISSELYNNKKYLTYFLYNFGVYNEDDDNILYWQLFKNILWHFLHIQFAIYCIKNSFWLICFTKRLVNSNKPIIIPRPDEFARQDVDYLATINTVVNGGIRGRVRGRGRGNHGGQVVQFGQ